MTDRAPAQQGRASFQRANDDSRERLARMEAALTPGQLRVDLGEGWTVASALAHTGFWDRWQAERWDEMLAGRWTADAESMIVAEHLANDALHPYWAGIDSEEIPALALAAATRLDALIAGAPDAVVDAIEGTPSAFILHRHRHRNEHLDHIERSLAAAGEPIASTEDALTDRSVDERNAAGRRRLASVVASIKPADLDRSTDPSEEASWTIGQSLGHLAFWDRFLASRWRAAMAAGPENLPSYLPDELADLLNQSLEPSLAAFAAGSAAGLLEEVVAAAAAIDDLISDLPPQARRAAVLAGRSKYLDRSIHRISHLDTIDRVLRR